MQFISNTIMTKSDFSQNPFFPWSSSGYGGEGLMNSKRFILEHSGKYPHIFLKEHHKMFCWNFSVNNRWARHFSFINIRISCNSVNTFRITSISHQKADMCSLTPFPIHYPQKTGLLNYVSFLSAINS